MTSTTVRPSRATLNRVRQIREFAQASEYTHATQGAGNLITLYGVTTCECCDDQIMEANPVGIVATLALASAAGLICEPTPPVEGGWSDDVGGVTCGCR